MIRNYFLPTIAFLPLACSGEVQREELPDPPSAELIAGPETGYGEVEATISREQSRVVTADYFVELPSGELLSFYVDEDGSAAVMGELSTKSTGSSVLDLTTLSDASPAEIYFAATQDGFVPPTLIAHHDGLARDGIIPSFEEATTGRTIGWISQVSMAGSGSPCTNATFTTNHCAHPSYADDLCFLNTSGSWQWNVGEVDRYKAGYCLQTGSNRSWLYYRDGGSPGGCIYFYLANFVWGSGSYYNGTKYSATTYRSYVWWRGSGSPTRAYYHFGGSGSGDVFDWGQRWTNRGCSG